ncbi:hypothetical protein ES708_28389 [subsurface metagenome]
MNPTVVSLLKSQFAVDSVIFAGPWIPTPRRKCRGGHPRRPLPLRSWLHLAQARFSRYFRPSDRPTNLPLSTVLTKALRLDSSYEATTPSRLDLVLRQRVELPHNFSSFRRVVASKLESSRASWREGRRKWGYR